jgi:5'-3' exonuclease
MNTTLLIDGNWLLMSRLFAVKSYFNVQNDDTEKQRGTAELEDLMCRSINLIINKFDTVVDNIILVADGGSWRKSLKKPSFFEEDYKGNRVKDVEIDWNYVYRSLENILERADELGITSCKSGGIEGDDWIFHWSRKLNNLGTNCIIWSSDADLKQLVQVKNGVFTAWLNESQKGGAPGIILHKDLDNTPTDDLDMFMQIDYSSHNLNELTSRVNFVTYINPDDIVMEKIICGDAGDNIKPIARVVCGSKTYKVSPKMWNEVKESLNINNLSDFFTHKNDIIAAISHVKKFVDCSYEDLSEMFDYNIKLVWLHESVVPETIIMYMNQLEYSVVDTNYIKSNFKTLCKAENEIESIFESVADEFAPF